MKLRTLEQFEDLVDADMAWRRRELVTLKLTVKGSRRHVTDLMIRAGIALLYAHYEGFTGRACRSYLDYVQQKRLRHDQLSDALLAIALKGKIGDLQQANAAWVHIAFASFLRTEMASSATFNSAWISTKSNLSSAVLMDIVTRLGISYAPFELRGKFIDELLVKRRNGVAHGDGLLIDVHEYLQFHDDTVLLIDDIRTEVLVAARTATYGL